MLALIDAILDGIDGGTFLVAPWKESEECRFCDFTGVCPTGRDAFLERKANDLRLAGLTRTIRDAV